MVEMGREDFERCVDAALDAIPDDLLAMIDNVAILVEDDAPADDPDLLGLYDGIPLTERFADYGGVLPDRIFIFRRNLLDYCEDTEQLVDEITATVVHELAHHFGIDDDRLAELGWD